jgi:hypothetical protein
VAVFSYRYDAHLVPDLIENLRPIVGGYIALDDRGAEELFSPEPPRRRRLIRAARDMGAQWVLSIDPDERLERAAAEVLPRLTAVSEPVSLGFWLRELYAPDAYRVDGLWGTKVRYRLFPLLEGQRFSKQPLHAPPHPRQYAQRLTGLNLYHLKMITHDRRVARRDLYRMLDPENALQPMGYDYLADDEGAQLEQIPPDRGYWPPHRDDGGSWMGDLGSGRAENSPSAPSGKR